LVGKTGLVDHAAEGAIFNNNLLRIRLTDQVLPEFAHLVINSRWFRSQIERVKRATTNVAAVYARDLLQLPIPLPSLPEQRARLEKVRHAQSFIEACERAVDAGLARSAALRRSILKAAFEGKLVPQDPNDEPASVLLERIAAERAAAPKPARRARKSA
jgi:type I restriction enzyme S subunit